MKSFLNAYLCLFLFAGSLSGLFLSSKCSANADEACVMECCEVTCCTDQFSGPAYESPKGCCEMSESDFEIQPFDPAFASKPSDSSKGLHCVSVIPQVFSSPLHLAAVISFQRPAPNLTEIRNLRI
ncbi:MAG: hypothetical protein K1X85_00970 [Ignavibacteria bacterium]|nr:hypothetical protein [Ignavibacteria bacterium]